MAFRRSWDTCALGVIHWNFNCRMLIKTTRRHILHKWSLLIQFIKPSRRMVKPPYNLVLPKKCNKHTQSLKMTNCQQYYAFSITWIPQLWSEVQRGQLCLTSQSFNICLNIALWGNLPKNLMQDGFYMQDTAYHSTVPGHFYNGLWQGPGSYVCTTLWHRRQRKNFSNTQAVFFEAWSGEWRKGTYQDTSRLLQMSWPLLKLSSQASTLLTDVKWWFCETKWGMPWKNITFQTHDDFLWLANIP